MKNLLHKVSLLLVLSLSLYSEVIKENKSVTKVFGSSPPMNYLIYALNPHKMVGLNFSAKNESNSADASLLGEYFLNLPVIGSFHGAGQGMNIETVIKHKPDLILVWEDDYLHKRVVKEVEKVNIATLTLPFRKIESMPDSILIAAKAIGEQNRGELLAKYAKERIENVKKQLHNKKATRYYYAQGVDGLATECSDSFHVEAMNFAGGENVHKCTQSNLRGLEKISFETLLLYKPEVIIAQNRQMYKEIATNPLWNHLEAVKNKKVFLVPNSPFNWLDRPPSFMRILGIEWLAMNFHPDLYKVDFEQQMKMFYKLFFNVELTQQDSEKILGV